MDNGIEDSNPKVAGSVDGEIKRGDAVDWFGRGRDFSVEDSGEPTVDSEIGSATSVGEYSTESKQ